MCKNTVSIYIVLILTLAISATRMNINTNYARHGNSNENKNRIPRYTDLENDSSYSQETDDFESVSYSEESESSSNSLDSYSWEIDYSRNKYVELGDRTFSKSDYTNKHGNQLNSQHENERKYSFQRGKSFGAENLSKNTEHYGTNKYSNMKIYNEKSQRGNKIHKTTKTGDSHLLNKNRNLKLPYKNTKIYSASRNTKIYPANKNTKSNPPNKATYKKMTSKTKNRKLNLKENSNYGDYPISNTNSERQSDLNMHVNPETKSITPAMPQKYKGTDDGLGFRKRNIYMQGRSFGMSANSIESDYGSQENLSTKIFSAESDKNMNDSNQSKSKQMGRGFQGEPYIQPEGNAESKKNDQFGNNRQVKILNSTESNYTFMDLRYLAKNYDDNRNNKLVDQTAKSAQLNDSNMRKSDMQGRNLKYSKSSERNKGPHGIGMMGRNMLDKGQDNFNNYGRTSPYNSDDGLTLLGRSNNGSNLLNDSDEDTLPYNNSNGPSFSGNSYTEQSLPYDIYNGQILLDNVDTGFNWSDENDSEQNVLNNSDIKYKLQENSDSGEKLPQIFENEQNLSSNSKDAPNFFNISNNSQILENDVKTGQNFPSFSSNNENYLLNNNVNQLLPRSDNKQGLPDYFDNGHNRSINDYAKTWPNTNDKGQNVPEKFDNRNNWSDKNDNFIVQDNSNNEDHLPENNDDGNTLSNCSINLPILSPGINTESSSSNNRNNKTTLLNDPTTVNKSKSGLKDGQNSKLNPKNGQPPQNKFVVKQVPSPAQQKQNSTSSSLRITGRSLSKTTCKKKKKKKRPRENIHTL